MAKRRAHGEGSVFKRTNGKWAGEIDLGVVAGKRVRRTVYGDTQAEVVARLAALKAERAAGATLAVSRDTLSWYLDDWLEGVVRPSVKPKTFASYSEIVRLHLKPALGAFRVSDLHPADVRRMMSEKLRSLSPRRVAMIRAVLGTALEVAVNDRRLNVNVAALTDPPSGPKKEIVPLSPAETRALLEELRGVGGVWEPLFLVCVTLGLRSAEALGLTWDRVDLAEGRVFVRQQLAEFTKIEATDLRALPRTATPWLVAWVPGAHRFAIASLKRDTSRRDLMLLPAVLERLRARHEALGKPTSGLVFTAEASGKPLLKRNVYRAWVNILRDAKLPKKRLHDARHGAGSLLLEAGVDLKVVSAFLGHSTITLTADTYLHVRRPVLDSATTALGALLAPKKEKVPRAKRKPKG